MRSKEESLQCSISSGLQIHLSNTVHSFLESEPRLRSILPLIPELTSFKLACTYLHTDILMQCTCMRTYTLY